MDKKPNVIQEKSYSFALRIIKLCQYLNQRNEFVLSKQLLRCGTSVGANVEEAIGGQSKKDFFLKITIAYKEARESHYWIRLLRDSNILTARIAESMLKDCDEILKLLTAIQKTTRQNLN